VDLHSIALRVAARPIVAVGELDVLNEYVNNVFNPLQKLLTSLTPVLYRLNERNQSLGGHAEAVEELVKKVLADGDVKYIRDGTRKYRWREILEFIKKLTQLLKELDAPMEDLEREVR
jgi:hypothetical protein